MQGRQNACPIFFWANPVGQLRHVDVSSKLPTDSEKRPDAQAMQEVLEAAPGRGDPCLPAPQLMHSDSLVIPTAALQRPGGHPAQSLAELMWLTSEYLPGGQSAHPSASLLA